MMCNYGINCFLMKEGTEVFLQMKDCHENIKSHIYFLQCFNPIKVHFQVTKLNLSTVVLSVHGNFLNGEDKYGISSIQSY